MSFTPPATTHPDVTAAPGQLVRTELRWARLRWTARVLLGLVIAVWGLLLVAWLALHWAILPHIEQWRGPIEVRASAALGAPVRIGGIEVRSSGWVPSLELREVLLLGADGQTALRLPRVFAAVSPRSLLSFELRFEQLLIDGAQLEARRDAQGRVFVAGIEVGGNASGNGHDAADWFFAQHEFVIRGGSLRWTDEQRNAAPLALTDVQLVVRNGLLRHDIRLDATPPADWGERFSVNGRFSQPLLARHGDWQRWSGEAHAELPRADVRELRRHLTLPFELSEGSGALRSWFELKNGQPVAATVDAALRSVRLRLAPEVEPIAIDELQGRFIGQRGADELSLAVQNLSFLTGEGMRWPQGDMKLTLRQREGQAATGGTFSAQRLDVAQMAQIASRVPLGDALRKLLVELNPKGTVGDLSASWDGPLDAPLHYRAKGTLSALSLAARASSDANGVGRPGLRGAALQLDASEAGGQARLAINGGALELPGVFDDPLLVLDQLSAQLLWKIEPAKAAGQPPKLSVQVKDARFANADAKGELSALWSSGAGTAVARGGRLPGRLELDGKLADGVAARVYRYLPRHIPKATREYLEHAIQSGKMGSAGFHVKGDLWDFPFFYTRADGKPGAARDGEFRITAKVDDASFAYVPSLPASETRAATVSPWPALAKASVELVLDHGALELRNGRAQIGNVELRGVQGAIRNLDSDGTLALDATARGPLAEMLRFVSVTPVGSWIGKALDTSSGSGNAELALGLNLPLTHLDASAVKGSVMLAGNDVRITPATPLLAGAKGRVDFSNKGFAVVGASAKVYGGDASFDGGSQPDGSVRFNGQGTVSADGLRHATELGAYTRAAAALTGQAAYRMSLGFVRGEPELMLTSNLAGLALNLPAPLNKAAETPLALRLQTSVEPVVAGQAPRDTLRFELGNVVQAQYLRELSSSEGPRVLRGGIGVFEPAPQPALGVAASVSLKTLDVDEWDAAADKLFGNNEAREAGAKGGYAPDAIGLRVQELTTGPRRLTHVSAGLSQDAGVWRANLDADQLNGYVEYRPPSRRGSAAAGRVYARLARLSLPKSDVDQVESLLDAQPQALPALDVVVEDFELRGKKLGRVEIEALNRSTPQGRDWQLSKFNISTPEAQLTATGHWSAVAPSARGATPPRRAVMDFKLALADSGALLDRLGTSKAIRGGKGQLSGQIAWIGSPFALDYPSLAGQINVAIDAGQFLKAEPGAARLLGVLSLQSLPRRLSLDFRDLFQEGFAFDTITGDVSIAQGVAKTNNLRMRGVQALVLMEGNADIASESQDLRVVVVPEISAGTAALAYAVINPAIGLGAFLAQALLKKPLTQAGTREFHVSGPWADPKVERVERKWSDDVPSFDVPASAPVKN